jgi:hypothetical protein
LRTGVWDLLDDEKRFFRCCCNGDDGREIEKQKESEKREDLSKHSQGIAGYSMGVKRLLSLVGHRLVVVVRGLHREPLRYV